MSKFTFQSHFSSTFHNIISWDGRVSKSRQIFISFFGDYFIWFISASFYYLRQWPVSINLTFFHPDVSHDCIEKAGLDDWFKKDTSTKKLLSRITSGQWFCHYLLIDVLQQGLKYLTAFLFLQFNAGIFWRNKKSILVGRDLLVYDYYILSSSLDVGELL